MRKAPPAAKSVRLTVRAKPRAKVSRVLRADDRTVDLALAAPPVDGAANEELVRLLAEVLGLPKRAVTLVVGASSKNKVVEIDGLTEDEIRTRLEAVIE